MEVEKLFLREGTYTKLTGTQLAEFAASKAWVRRWN